jgi:Flp pilus assembly protein TadD
VRLARRQEERLAALEKSVSARDTTLRESEARLQALSARLVEQQDLAAALEGARQAAVQAQAEAEAAGRRAAASETRLSESQKETTALREALAKARAGQATDAELRAHLEAAERAAEQERGKVRLLEQALAERAAAAPAPPAASTETADGAWRELRQQVAVLEIKLDDRDKEVKVLREELAKERTARAPADDPLLDELRTLNRELDRERERVRKLEQALVQQAGRGTTAMVVPGLPAALAPAPSPADMALGFLQTAAGAEQQGRTETAIWNYRKALEYEPANRLALKRLGLLAAQAGNDEDAADFLRRAFYGDPDDVDILLPLGFALVRQGQVDLALSSLARAAALRPDDAGVHRAYGVACSTLGWPDAAEAQLRRAFQIDPQDGEAAFNLAVLLAARKPPRLQEARGWYGKARTLGVAADPGLDRLFGEKENTKP